jgi:hypothetical protein
MHALNARRHVARHYQDGRYLRIQAEKPRDWMQTMVAFRASEIIANKTLPADGHDMSDRYRYASWR